MISVKSQNDIVLLLEALSQVRRLLFVQVDHQEEEILKKSIW